MRDRDRGLTISALLVLVCLGPGAGAGEARDGSDISGIGIQLLDAPVSRKDDPRALRYIVDHLPPGTEIHRDVLVVNKSDKQQVIEMYPGAATIEDGGFRFDEGRNSNELASWVSVDRQVLDLGPGESAKLAVAVAVPPAAPSGERYAVLWASSVAPAADPANHVEVMQVHRVGIRLYLDVGPGGEPASSFTLDSVLPSRNDQGDPSVAIAVANTGGRALDLVGEVSLSDGPGGLGAGPFEVVKGTTLAPGQSGSVTVRFPHEVPDGPWTIEADLTSGTAKGSTKARITFPPPGQVGEAGFPLPGPWVLTGLAVALLVGLYLARHRLRRVFKAKTRSTEPSSG